LRKKGERPHKQRVSQNNVFSPLSDDWNLEITNVTLNDDGDYECQILGSRSPVARLSVYVAPEHTYIDGGTAVAAIEGRELKLTCVSTGGKPAPKVRTKFVFPQSSSIT